MDDRYKKIFVHLSFNITLFFVKFNDMKSERSKLYRAAGLALLATFSYTVMNLCIKLTKHDANQAIIGVVRFLIGWFYINGVILFKHSKSLTSALTDNYTTSHWWPYLARAAFTVLSVSCAYYALQHIPVTNAMALMMTQALFIPLLERIVYRRKLSFAVVLAILIGFVGVAISLNLSLDRSMLSVGALAALVSGMSIAITYLSLRYLTHFDSPQRILTIHLSLVLVLFSVYLIFNWQLPTLPSTWFWLGMLSVAGTFYQEFITRAMQLGPAKLVSTLQYFSIIFGAILGWLVWHEKPVLTTCIGSVLIILGSVLTIVYSASDRKR